MRGPLIGGYNVLQRMSHNALLDLGEPGSIAGCIIILFKYDGVILKSRQLVTQEAVNIQFR
jgi:hypothetical protein